MRDDVVNALDQCDIAEGAMRRIFAAATPAAAQVARRDLEGALHRLRRHLEDHLPDAPQRPDTRCTGIAASWCPVHGECSCPKQEKTGEPVWRNGERVENEACPLHGRGNNHAKAPLAG